MEMLRAVSQTFWSPSFWLVDGMTWEDMKSTNKTTMPEFSDLLYYGLRFTLLIVFARYAVLEPLVFRPIGRALGIWSAPRIKPEQVYHLELIFQSSNKVPHSVMVKMAQELGWTVKKVQIWFKTRKLSGKPTQMFKFCDVNWHLTYHVVIFIMGLYVLHDKSWLWDIKLCWVGYPCHSLDEGVWWYYMFAFSFYIYSTFTFLLQHQRKDSVQMFLHHIITLLLIIFSWAVNFIRIGTLILLIHEFADIPLLMGKLTKFTKMDYLRDVCFVLFVICWVLSRTLIYPLWIVRTTLVDMPLNKLGSTGTFHPLYVTFNVFLLTLLALHIGWTLLIGEIMVKKFRGDLIEDVRSDSESDVSDSENLSPLPEKCN